MKHWGHGNHRGNIRWCPLRGKGRIDDDRQGQRIVVQVREELRGIADIQPGFHEHSFRFLRDWRGFENLNRRFFG